MNAAHIIALYAHTAAITNARNDYRARPTRACHGHDYARICDQLAPGDDIYCDTHRERADISNAKRRQRAAERAAA